MSKATLKQDINNLLRYNGFSFLRVKNDTKKMYNEILNYFKERSLLEGTEKAVKETLELYHDVFRFATERDMW